jgi:dTDP-glucose 4,6-dehydratase
VTGGLGFIGSNFIRYVLERHMDVRIVNVDNLSYGGNQANLWSSGEEPRYSSIRGDITDKVLITKLVRNTDVVVNFAAESHVDRSIADSWPFVRSNTEGVLTILDALRRKAEDTKLIQIGTDEVYGDIVEGSAKEDDKLNPSSPYAVSKASADMFCLAYRRTYGLKLIITRCTNNFGPFQFPEKLIPKTIISALKNTPIALYGSGRQVRDWIYVKDHCEALDLVIKEGRAGEIYNISTGIERDNFSIVESVLKIMKKDSSLIRHVDDRPGHDSRYSLDSSKIRHELGWKPRHRFLESLRDTVEWYMRNQLWWKPLISEKILSPEPWKEKW